MKTKFILMTIGLLLLGGCGSSSKKNTINMVDYLPSENTIKKFFTTKDNGHTNFYEEDVTVGRNKITFKRDNNITKILTINETTIVANNIEKNITKILKKSISKGDTLYTLPKVTSVEEIKFEDTVLGTRSIESTKTCKLEKKLDKLENYDIKYYDDILKFKCIENKKIVTHVQENLPDYIHLTNGEEASDYDISYFYMKKDTGMIVTINDNCIVKNSDGVTRINDSSSVCDERHYSRTFFLE